MSYTNNTNNSTIEYNSGNDRCEICGKPFTYVGDFPYGGFEKGNEPYCTCKKFTKDKINWCIIYFEKE